MIFGPDDYVNAFAAANDQPPTSPTSANQFPGPYLFGTQAPAAGGAYPLGRTTHGNGFEWRPLVTPAGPGAPGPSVKITFTQAGTYHDFCGIHGRDIPAR